MQRILRIPKVQMFLFLFFIFLTGIFNYKNLLFPTTFVLSVVFTVLLDFIFLKIRKVELFPPYAAFVTGSIIGLIASPNIAWYQLALVCTVAMASKNFIRFDKKHIFNPAAFGVFFTHILFGQIVSWWGVTWQQFRIQNLEFIIPIFFLVLPAYVSAYKMRRWKIIVSFLLIYYLLNIKNGLAFDPTVMFFAFVMLPEPMTTPSKTQFQILFGVIVALLARFMNFSWLPDVFVPALLAGNLLFFKYKK